MEELTPTKDEIAAKAEELYRRENLHLGVSILPEEEELREGGYWNRAQSELMTSDDNLNREQLRKAKYELTLELRRLEEALGERAVDKDVKALLDGFEDRLKALESKAVAASVLNLFYCHRCEHTWEKRKGTVGDPSICPKCKSKLWNVSKHVPKHT